MNNSRLRALLDLDKSALPADGGAAFNRLIFARSPYLLQHAENPVDWREWGDAAFAEARQRDLPLMISIGYATCHWCHVMAAESFSDAQVAAQLNSSFVAVKVDREERPDIDDFFMTASRVLTGSGGWPLNVFVDHDRRPFFAITYLPKEPRQQTPGFLSLLANLSSLWQARREMVFNNASEIERSLRAMAESQPATGDDIASVAGKAVNELAGMFDPDWGGFGRAVKFPMPTYLHFLLSRDNGQARGMALQTLEKMSAGGINDQLAGGFHRYAIDRHWQIPHFEKMLYDQALLITTYLDAFAKDGNRLFLDTAVSTTDFAVKELLDENGAFCAGLDADSEGEEGLYYTWSYTELAALLDDDFAAAVKYWGITTGGNLDGRSTLHRMIAAPDATGTLAATIDRCRDRLLLARNRREPPLRDPKIICAWNGLMISALVRLAAVTGEAGWLRQATVTASFILENMVTAEGRLLRNWLGTPAPVYAFAEDYVFFCLGLADLAAASKEPVWTEKLAYFGGELLRLFIDVEGGITFAGSDTEGMPVSIPPLQDGVMPSAAGACATLLIRMAEIFANRDFAAAAGRIIANSRGVTERNPAACLSLIMAEEQLRRISS